MSWRSCSPTGSGRGSSRSTQTRQLLRRAAPVTRSRVARVRLQRFLAQAGIASRRKSEDLIAAGVVKVNDRVVTEPGTTVDPDADEVRVKGRSVRARFAEDSPGHAIGIALHKPRGVLTARSDARGRSTVYDQVD